MTFDPDVVRSSLMRQSFMRTLGAEVIAVEPGRVVLELAFRDDLCQQNCFLHAGVVTSVADSACGYAALSLMPPGSDVLSVGFTVNLLVPAAGTRIRATGSVVRAGRTLTVCSGEVVGVDTDGTERQVAVMQATMIARSSAAPGG
jgi:uncharacterized protein (TIGR00369 family)